MTLAPQALTGDGGDVSDPQELLFAGEPDAVSQARRFTVAVLSGFPDEVVSDAELIVTELVTNALLHADPPVLLRVRRRDHLARIEVHDRGSRPPLRIRDAGEAMTGRGLALVAALSRTWGADRQASGKVVWAELGTDLGLPTTPSPALDLDRVLSSWDAAVSPSPEQLHTVELGDVPTGLLLEAKSHVDNLVREFVLASAGTPRTVAGSLSGLGALVHSVVHDFAAARTQIKEQALASAARGATLTHLVLRLPAASAEAGDRYLAALDEADRYARAARLLTLEAPAVHKIFRRWYVEALIDQLRSEVEGGALTRPPTFAERLAQ
jgi:anti-sigma regulatory factor (Ser/Thr protein kinase)